MRVEKKHNHKPNNSRSKSSCSLRIRDLIKMNSNVHEKPSCTVLKRNVLLIALSKWQHKAQPREQESCHYMTVIQLTQLGWKKWNSLCKFSVFSICFQKKKPWIPAFPVWEKEFWHLAISFVNYQNFNKCNKQEYYLYLIYDFPLLPKSIELVLLFKGKTEV
jgi:hypothetical protein